MAQTIRTHLGTGSATVYDVSFDLGYLSRDHIYVYQGEDYTQNQIAFTWVSNTQIQCTVPVNEGFYIRRVVPRNAPINNYSDGAILRERNLDASFAQSLMILEEIQDGFTGLVQFDLSVPLDMNGQQIRQLADGIEEDDAINLGQARRVFQAIKGGAIITYADQAEPTASEYPEGTKWLVIDTHAEYTQIEGFWVEDGKVGDNVDVTAASYLTLAEAQASNLKVGQYVRLTDYANAFYKVVADSDTGGLYKNHNTTGLKLRLIDELGFLKTAGYVSDTTGATIVYSQLSEMVENAKLTGLALISRPSDVYNVGGFPDTSYLSKFIIDTDGFTWHTSGCEFILQANTNIYHDAKASQILFEVEANDIDIGDIKATADTIARDESDRQGVQAYWFRNNTRNTRNNKIGRVTGSKLVSCVLVSSDSPDNFRLRGLEHGLLFNDGGYYVLNCANNGDGVVGSLSSNDCIRTYFCYGVKGHTETINTYNHFKFSDVVVSRYSRDTEDINITYTCHFSNTSSGVISFEHINDDTNSTIKNVTINFGVTVSNPANPSINFKSFQANGAVESTTSKNFTDIRLYGNTNSTTPINLATEIVGNSNNSIYIEKDELIGQGRTKGFNFILGKSRIAFGDSSDMTAKFNVSELIFVPSWGKLTVTAVNDGFNYDGTYMQRDYYVCFSLSSDGSLSVLNTTLISDLTVDDLSLTPNILFPAQPVGSYMLEVEVSNLTGANRFVKCSLELFSVRSPI
jgi:hypothetical protein